ncbi:MAG: DUF1073 domain-containing protein [Spirochaetaceae bacterium]|nr:DUF1073 domain-containing protein [Spirochaetaceae bacterium]
MSKNRNSRNVAKRKTDGWKNLISGLGSAKTEKKSFTHHALSGVMSDRELESLYYEDGLSARIVKLLPDDMFREGWDYSFPKLDELKAAETAELYAGTMEEIGAQQKIKDAMTWKRLYGGSAIFISAMDGSTPDKPLVPKKIRTIECLRVIERTEIDFNNIVWQTNPMKPRYGMPEVYPVKFEVPGSPRTETMNVHWTRIIELHGDTLPRHSITGINAENRYWGISALQRANDRLKSLGSSLGSIDQLLSELGVGKYKIKDLATLLSTPDGEEAIKRRVELTDLVKSTFRSMYLDNEEEFVRDNISFAGVPEILHILFMLISSDTGYPMTRLFGMSPAGMNSTGESDMNNYYDMVRSLQTSEIQPVILRLVRIIAEWKGWAEPYIEFRPLETMNEKEKAELEKQKADREKVEADTYKQYIDAGVLEPYEVRFLKYGNTLDAIPVPEDLKMPPVEEVLDEPPEDGDGSDDGATEDG